MGKCDKIVYVNQEELVGVTSSSNVLEWHLWKLREKGCSNNIIYFNDDCFIGQPLKESDFFYQNDKKEVVPYIFYNEKISKISKKKIAQKLNSIKKEVSDDNMKKQDNLSFWHQIFSGRKFLYRALDKRIILNSCDFHFPHNAIPINLSELKSLYDVVRNKYPHWKDCILAKNRKLNAIVFQDFYNFYHLNADDRKINNNIKYKYFDLANKNIVDDINKNKYDLFCINTGGGRNYTNEERLKARETMNKLFPDKSVFEKELEVSKVA